MHDYIEKKRLAILQIINDKHKPVGSQDISVQLNKMGYNVSERTVRFHLTAMDKDGYTQYLYKKGRVITEKGQKELAKARIYEKIGFLTAKIDQMTYMMSFNLSSREGTVLLNTSILEKKYLKDACPLIQKVFAHGLAMGNLMTILTQENAPQGIIIPDDCVGIGTICSITINGILLTHGIPTRSRFGGLLELEKGEPVRFVALINYDGTSLDPLEIFIKSGMTNYLGATGDGNGLIGASFRELPLGSRDEVLSIAEQLKKIDLGGFFRIGYPESPLCGIPVNNGTFGSIIIGGLNPVALLVESGIPVESKALSTLIDFSYLFHYSELDEKISQIDI
ncbi:MAG: DUF128 domain-containing protein [Spirochaetales bacterium]|nr:DUF128 domain-containing protein [Spirochaetales bacterium]